MALILSIETSTSVCSAALHESGVLIADEIHREPQSSASQLAVMIERLFLSNKIDKKSLKAVAVSSGPGSYTGLRIGASTAKGICFGLDLPLISLGSLHASAAGLPNPGTHYLCPMIDARRMEVYCSLLSPSLEVIEGVQAKVIDENSFADTLQLHTISFFGNGSYKCKAVIQHSNALFIEGVEPLAKHMGKLVYTKFLANDFEDLHPFEPRYLKEFVAKTKSR